MKSILLMLLLLISSALSAQFVISGKVVAEKNKPATGATILLLQQKDSALITSLLSDQDGHFQFSHVHPGQYLVCLSMLGYEKAYITAPVIDSNIQLKDTRLVTEVQDLEDVTVIAHKPFLQQKPDKLIVNVESSATAAGSSALEILQKVPGVLVLNEKVTVFGKGNPLIMIDGRASPYINMSQVLRSMSAANIDRIELISNPGAKYDATGSSIINIILKRNADIGTNGNLTLTTGTGLFDQLDGYKDNNFYHLAPDFSINHRKGKVNLYGSYGFFHRNEYDYNEVTRYIAGNTFFQTNYSPDTDNNHTYRAGIDFYANKKNIFGFELNGLSNKNKGNAIGYTTQSDSATSQLLSSFQTRNNTYNTQVNNSYNLNWKHNFDSAGKELNIDIDYSRFRLNENSDITTILANTPSLSNQSISNPLHFLVLKADYTMPVHKEDKLEIGAKSSFTTINNTLVFSREGIIDNTRSTDFQYTENINAVYTSFEKNIDKWKLTAGLRTEQTIAKGVSASQQVLNRSYWQLFPSFVLTRKINTDLSAVLQYSRRVNRPGYEQQNPFVEYLDSLTYEKGNPLLQPEVIDEYKLSFNSQNSPILAVSYNKKHNVIVNSAPNQIGNITYISPQNLASYENIAVELNFPVELGKKLTGAGSLQGMYNHYNAYYLNGQYDQRKWNGLAYCEMAYKPSPTWSIEATGFYVTKLLDEFTITNGFGGLNCGVQHSLWDRKGKISLNVNDVLFSQKIKSTLNYEIINAHIFQQEESRNIKLSFNYYFGNQRLKAVRNRNKASEEEKDRVKLKD